MHVSLRPQPPFLNRVLHMYKRTEGITQWQMSEMTDILVYFTIYTMVIEALIRYQHILVFRVLICDVDFVPFLSRVSLAIWVKASFLFRALVSREKFYSSLRLRIQITELPLDFWVCILPVSGSWSWKQDSENFSTSCLSFWLQ